MANQSIQILPATRDDVGQILLFIRELAEYEKLSDCVVATEALLQEHLFGPRPTAECVIARVDGKPAGFALFFHNFSTFLAKPGIYLEDLYVRPQFRGNGVGKALLRHLAQLVVERKCGRLEWAVLDWNAPAIGFYRRLGAVPMNDWHVYRLSGDSLSALATGQ